MYLPYLFIIVALLLSYHNRPLFVLGERGKLGFKLRLTHISLVVSIVAALLVGVLSFIGLLILALLAASIFAICNNRMWRAVKIAAYFFVIILCYLLAVHALPGFQNVKVLDGFLFGKSDIPFVLYANFDKGFAGALLFCFLAQRLRSWEELSQVLLKAKWLPLYVFALFMLAVYLGLEFDPKFNVYVLQFLVINLFFTCVAEEAFFRLLIQNGLERVAEALGLDRAKAIGLALIFVTGLFCWAHYDSSVATERMLLISISGAIYAYSYAVTRSIEVAIATHFSVNLVHILFFVYP